MAKRALCIGINTYPGAASDLRGCVHDAEDWAGELKARGFEAALLLDGNAQKAALLYAIREMVASVGAGDLLVITYSGHCTWLIDELDGREEALVPYDVRQAGPLPTAVLRDVFAHRTAGARILLIIDASSSGQIARKLAPSLTWNGGRVRFLPPEHFLDARQLSLAKLATRFPQSPAPRGDILWLSAAEGGEHALELELEGRTCGAFTHCALKALRGLPATATYLDWYRALRGYLPSVTHPQRPRLDGTREQINEQIFT